MLHLRVHTLRSWFSEHAQTPHQRHPRKVTPRYRRRCGCQPTQRRGLLPDEAVSETSMQNSVPNHLSRPKGEHGNRERGRPNSVGTTSGPVLWGRHGALKCRLESGICTPIETESRINLQGAEMRVPASPDPNTPPSEAPPEKSIRQAIPGLGVAAWRSTTANDAKTLATCQV